MRIFNWIMVIIFFAEGLWYSYCSYIYSIDAWWNVDYRLISIFYLVFSLLAFIIVSLQFDIIKESLGLMEDF